MSCILSDEELPSEEVEGRFSDNKDRERGLIQLLPSDVGVAWVSFETNDLD